MAEHIVRRTLFEVPRDSRRSIRNLVDLGLEVSGSRLQKRMMGVFQGMLDHEDSPYYDLILNTIHHVDHDLLTTFGVNFGWNALTAGAAHIREMEVHRGHNIPWSLTLHIAAESGSMTGGGITAWCGTVWSLESMCIFSCRRMLLPSKRP